MSGKAQSPYERHVFVPDPHPPFHSEEACAVAVAFIREYRPDRVWFLGDILDFYQLSHFEQDPRRALDLQDDIDCARSLLARFREAAPDARAVLIRGNHEDRLRRFLWTAKNPALSSLRGLDVPALLGLDKLGIEYAERGRVRIADFVIKHGDIVRPKAGYTAHGELEREGLSGVSGHTHRLGQVCLTTTRGPTGWAEAGCLCDLDPPYLRGATANWQHGLAYAYMERNGNRFVNHTLPIVNGRCIFNGREISAKRKGRAA